MKTKHKFTNNLKEFVIKKRSYLEMMHGKRITLQSIIADISKYCGCETETITMIYRKVNNPSLYTALKIAKYFEVNVEKIFDLNE